MTAGIGLFGGAFNPPHNGHVSAAAQAMEALALDKLYVMPTGHPPHKALPPDAPPPFARLAMTGLAFSGLPGCVVSDWELARQGRSYTVDTLDWLQERYPDATLTLLVGADMFLSLQEWYRAEDIFLLARVAVLARAAGQDKALAGHAAFLAHRFDAAIDIIPHTPIAVSSSELRLLLKAGGGRDYLPEPVAAYIAAHHLYE